MTATTQVNVELQVLDERYFSEWGMPRYATPGSAGLDIRASIEETIAIDPSEKILLSSGLKLWIKNPNYVLFLLPRSGLGCSGGVILGNGTGVIDSDYQGELKICVWNRNRNESVRIQPGQLVCQAVLLQTAQMDMTVVSEFNANTIRGDNGFGSTGSV